MLFKDLVRTFHTSVESSYEICKGFGEDRRLRDACFRLHQEVYDAGPTLASEVAVRTSLIAIAAIAGAAGIAYLAYRRSQMTDNALEMIKPRIAPLNLVESATQTAPSVELVENTTQTSVESFEEDKKPIETLAKRIASFIDKFKVVLERAFSSLREKIDEAITFTHQSFTRKYNEGKKVLGSSKAFLVSRFV